MNKKVVELSNGSVFLQNFNEEQRYPPREVNGYRIEKASLTCFWKIVLLDGSEPPMSLRGLWTGPEEATKAILRLESK